MRSSNAATAPPRSFSATLRSEQQVWMSHRDAVTEVPAGFVVTSHTDVCPVASMECAGATSPGQRPQLGEPELAGHPGLPHGDPTQRDHQGPLYPPPVPSDHQDTGPRPEHQFPPPPLIQIGGHAAFMLALIAGICWGGGGGVWSFCFSPPSPAGARVPNSACFLGGRPLAFSPFFPLIFLLPGRTACT